MLAEQQEFDHRVQKCIVVVSCCEIICVIITGNSEIWAQLSSNMSWFPPWRAVENNRIVLQHNVIKHLDLKTDSMYENWNDISLIIIISLRIFLTICSPLINHHFLQLSLWWSGFIKTLVCLDIFREYFRSNRFIADHKSWLFIYSVMVIANLFHRANILCRG